MNIPKIENMTNGNGNTVPNQLTIITIENGVTVEYFQSYKSIIVRKEYNARGLIQLDEKYWNYSKTTSKYRNQFLNETTKETQAKIDNGTYILTNLN
jgi:hypothetical protein